MKEIYQKECIRLKENIRKVDSIIELNTYLSNFNWAFIHPYLFGFELQKLESFKINNDANSEKIFSIFAESFFDLRTTSAFIEGFFKKRPNLKPFCILIDQSVILCLQKDYAGAINILLPVIEGSIRDYFVNNLGKSNDSIMKSEDFLKVFNHLKVDYLQIMKEYYVEIYSENTNTDISRVRQLIKYENVYISKWFSIIIDYLKNNLYFDTRDGNVPDKLNRHSILHGFNSDIYYSLKNYLRLYNCITFLSWAFGMADKNASLLAMVTNEEINYKWKNLEKIKFISQITSKYKEEIYSKYSEFDRIEFLENYDSNFDKQFLKVKGSIEKKLKHIDKMFEQ